MNLPSIDPLDLTGKRILLRGDTDVEGDNVLRLRVLSDTIKRLLGKNPAKIVILGHRGRPNGVDPNLTMEPIATTLTELVEETVTSIPSIFPENLPETRLCMLENLRFDSSEESNDEGFASRLAGMGDVYVNEAFGVSHREHASIVEIPKFIPSVLGPRFISEIENLSSVFENPKRPVTILISGVKSDKLKYVAAFKQFADKILIAGRLPELLEKWEFDPEGDKEILNEIEDERVVVAKLLPDKDDITINSIESFEREIEAAGTIVVGGPVGKFEEEGHRQGTDRVFRAIAASAAFKVAGGGDTEAALNLIGITDKFDWVSVGGGAMLEFLSNKTLPGIDAISQ